VKTAPKRVKEFLQGIIRQSLEQREVQNMKRNEQER